MKKKSLFLLFLFCVVLLIPKNTFALQVYNNVNIDYSFFVDEDEADAGNLKFKLYDKSETLDFESQYDSSTKQYYFKYDEFGFMLNPVSYYGDYLTTYDYQYGNSEVDYRPYVPYRDELKTIDNSEDFDMFIRTKKLHGGNSYFSNSFFYTYIPLIFEEINTHTKKIVLASFSYVHLIPSSTRVPEEYVQLFFVNNTVKWKEENATLFDNFIGNVDFMRKTTLDYSDELWEELNNGSIASSEIYSNNINSDNYHYVNQSINGDIRNVPEETLDDYASSLPVFSYKKVNSAGENKNDNTNNIVEIITNPKTWNNGILVLIISMIIVGISSMFLIKRKS